MGKIHEQTFQWHIYRSCRYTHENIVLHQRDVYNMKLLHTAKLPCLHLKHHQQYQCLQRCGETELLSRCWWESKAEVTLSSFFLKWWRWAEIIAQVVERLPGMLGFLSPPPALHKQVLVVCACNPSF